MMNKKRKWKKKLKKNLSSCELINKEYKLKKQQFGDEEQDEDEDRTKKNIKKEIKNNKKGKQKNRQKSVKNIGNYINNVLSNVLGNLGIEGFDNLNIENLGDLDNINGSTIIINNNNSSPFISLKLNV
jgi:hypothetical protein